MEERMSGTGGLRRIRVVMSVEYEILLHILEGPWEAFVTLIYQVAELRSMARSYRKANISIVLYPGIESRS